VLCAAFGGGQVNEQMAGREGPKQGPGTVAGGLHESTCRNRELAVEGCVGVPQLGKTDEMGSWIMN
jgi:hypothetical protein